MSDKCVSIRCTECEQVKPQAEVDIVSHDEMVCTECAGLEEDLDDEEGEKREPSQSADTDTSEKSDTPTEASGSENGETAKKPLTETFTTDNPLEF